MSIIDDPAPSKPAGAARQESPGWPWWMSWAVIFVLAAAVALFSYRYMFGIPPVPLDIGSNIFRPGWLAIHASSAATALLIGSVQFSAALRGWKPSVHRIVGRVYAISCVAGGISGLILAFGSQAGPIATAGFGLLAIVWLLTVILGSARARQRQFASHRRWMIRSWSLTLAAVTLRLYLPLAAYLELDDLSAYRAIAFLCWVPNFLAAELLLRRS